MTAWPLPRGHVIGFGVAVLSLTMCRLDPYRPRSTWWVDALSACLVGWLTVLFMSRIGPGGRDMIMERLLAFRDVDGSPVTHASGERIASERNEREPHALHRRQMSVDHLTTPAAHPPTSSAFERFFRQEHPRSLRLAWLLTHSQSAAEDIVQEAMLATHARFDELDEPAAFLTRVLINKCHSWTRQDMSHRRLLRSIPAPAPEPDSSSDVELLDAVRRLPYRQQVVIVTRYWGGWSEREIASALECRPGTVKSLASRAMDQLQKELSR